MEETKHQQALFEYLVALGDDHLILGHRMSEWCGHAPMLEEDLALSNIALDLLGQARVLLSLAGEIEGKGRSEDDLAFLRIESDYRNLILVEKPNGDFARTIMRQFLFSVLMEQLWAAMGNSSEPRLVAIAQKAKKEVAYHLRHTAQWIIRLGDGTQTSADRIANAITYLAPDISEMFIDSELDQLLVENGTVPARQSLRENCEKRIADIFDKANIDKSLLNADQRQYMGRGKHTESMGHILAQMQYMQRTYPNCQW